MKIKLLFAASVLLISFQSAFCQNDSILRFDGIDISLKYDQGILRKVPETKNYVKIYEEREAMEINTIIIQRDRVIAPADNINLLMNNLNTIGINGKRNYGKSLSIGAIVGAVIGLVPTLFFATTSSNSSEAGYCIAVGGIFTAMTTAAGCLLGLLITPKEYEEVKLFGYDNQIKHKLIIESLNKNKMQGL